LQGLQGLRGETGATGPAGPQGEPGSPAPARRIFATTANSRHFTSSAGNVPGRVLTFTKIESSTALRFTYTDTFSNQGSGGASWEIRLNGQSVVNPGPVKTTIYDNGNDRIWRTTTLHGIAKGIPAGQYTMTVYAAPITGAPTIDTGYNVTAYLEVEELTYQEN
jgi:hypothetical protein